LKHKFLAGFVIGLPLLVLGAGLGLAQRLPQPIAGRSGQETVHTQATAPGWLTEKMASAEGETSLALDSSDRPHIAYADPSTHSPAYARWNGTSWETQTVDASAWASELALALDAADGDRPYVAYRDFKAFPSSLKVAFLDGATWLTATVEVQSNSGRYPSLVVKDRTCYLCYKHVDDMMDSHLYYATFSPWPGEWPPGPLAVDGLGPDSPSGWACSLALDPGDEEPAISYNVQGSLGYAYIYNSSWYTRTVDSSANVGAYSSLAINSLGSARISYFDDNADDLKYAYWQIGLPGHWVTEKVDGDGAIVGRYTSLALGSDGRARISYYDSTNGRLKFATQQSGGSWKIQVVESGDSLGWYSSLALDGSDRAHIGYLDHTNHELRYACQLPFSVWMPVVLKDR